MRGMRGVLGCALLGCGISTGRAAIIYETVPVRDAGNTGILSGAGAGIYGYGPNRVCGAVDYEYRIGTYEVTAGQYTVFLNAIARQDRYGAYISAMGDPKWGCGITRSGGGTTESPYTYAVATAYIDRPVTHVSFSNAARFANWMHHDQPTGVEDLTTTEDGAYFVNGARTLEPMMAITRKAGAAWAIPTEDEWFKAAYYNAATQTYYQFPTRSNDEPGSVLADPAGNNANYEADYTRYPIDAPYYTTVVGEFQNSLSPYGTYDQGGNVSEWNEAIVTTTTRGIRGGTFYDNDSVYLRGVYRESNEPTSAYEFYGFRLVQLPEPATAGLMVAGLVVLTLRKRPTR
jgi:formylglycine-generating enzyme